MSAGLDPSALAALCEAAMPEEHLTEGELAYLCFGDNDEVFGDERGAAVLQTEPFGQHVAAWLTLVVVRPDEQSRGRGKELVHTVAERARELGARDLLLASAVPRYLWPGVDVTNTRGHAVGVVRLRARLDRHEHGHRHDLPPRHARRHRDRTRDR